MRTYRTEVCGLICMLIILGCEPPENTSTTPNEDLTSANPVVTNTALETEIAERSLEYRDEMRNVADTLRPRYESGIDDIRILLEVEIKLIEAELSAATSADERLATLKKGIERLRAVEASEQQRIDNGTGGRAELGQATVARILAEILFHEERHRQRIANNPNQTAADTTAEAELRDLRSRYRDAMRLVADIQRHRYQTGNDSIQALQKTEMALTEAELSAATSSEEKIGVLETMLKELKSMEAYQQFRFENGSGRRDELSKARAARILGEIRILESRQKQRYRNDLNHDPIGNQEDAKATEVDIESELKKLRSARNSDLKAVVDELRRRYREGNDNIEFLLKAEIVLAEAELSAATSHDERLNVLSAIVEKLREHENFQQMRTDVGSGRRDELAQARAARIFGELMILKERQQQQRK